jgi:hypothetical protein
VKFPLAKALAFIMEISARLLFFVSFLLKTGKCCARLNGKLYFAVAQYVLRTDTIPSDPFCNRRA